MSNTTDNRIGEYVIYKNVAICRISDICERDFGGESRTYYVLDTIGENSSRIYLPLDSPFKLRHVLNREEINSVLDEAAQEIADLDADRATRSPLWSNDPKVRAALFDGILASGDRVRILRMLSLLAHNRDSLAKLRKKPYAADDRAFKQAVKLIDEEFSFVLNIPKDSVGNFIRDKLNLDMGE